MHEPKGIHRRTSFTLTDDLQARFWRRVEKHEEGCWQWLGAQRNGYGAIRHGGNVLSPHVVAYVIQNGEIPPGKLVCHTCDNRLCVRPDHLYAGDFTANVRDMFDRRRISAARGNECWNAALTADIARRAWALQMTRGWGCRRVGKALGVSEHAIHYLFNKGGWSHVSKPSLAECEQPLAETEIR